MSAYALEPIGFIRSTVKGREARRGRDRKARPTRGLEIEPRFAEALLGIEVGHELIVITWLHEAKRDVLQGHPRNDPNRPLTGVFYTRSPARPNPLGLHPVTVREIDFFFFFFLKKKKKKRHAREDRADRGIRRHTPDRYGASVYARG